HLRNRAQQRNPEHVEEDVDACHQRGVLFASGLIVGESLMGVIIAMIIVFSITTGGSEDPLALVGKDFANTADLLGLGVFVLSIVYFIYHILSTKFTPSDK
ncbi:MAG: oligopeptide transporter, OPT family, partial [Megasphaera micronuciformis]|nr:oligopeptide transporter, OPT family [Megasphaera micronuciformis]